MDVVYLLLIVSGGGARWHGAGARDWRWGGGARSVCVLERDSVMITIFIDLHSTIVWVYTQLVQCIYSFTFVFRTRREHASSLKKEEEEKKRHEQVLLH